ncbi:polysaccharide biosynthesis/export family protein [Sphingobacterium sp.]|uniref:polysaccharide biosynthesis/export family protein n=1 Tax=Sphingobacterium sp. TaxID=341027 RepID=UPI00289EEA57|nr:polysaccharide biosynthesis/export family protein [Sphingobacterium sp.]
MSKLKYLIVLACLGILIMGATSCANKKDLIYFQPDSLTLDSSFESNAPRLQPGDILTISITADDVRATEPFNQTNVYQAGALQTNNPFIPTYTIDLQGNIVFPKIGEVKLGGKTRLEAMEYLREQVSKYIINPGVNMSIRNFQITVLGEVTKPGTYFIEHDRISLLEALGLAGDMTINGVRKNVLVIREEGGDRNEYRVDLTKRESLKSPVYFLKQNDVVYVEPNDARIQSSKYTQNTSIFVSIAGLIITIVAVIVR